MAKQTQSWFDPDLSPDAWFDPDLLPEAWFDDDLYVSSPGVFIPQVVIFISCVSALLIALAL